MNNRIGTVIPRRAEIPVLERRVGDVIADVDTRHVEIGREIGDQSFDDGGIVVNVSTGHQQVDGRVWIETS